MLNIILSAVFLTGSTILFINSFSISGSTKWDILGARFFPQVLLGIAIFFSLIIFINSLRENRGRTENDVRGKESFWSTYKDTLVIFACVFLFLIGFDLLGFFIGAFAFLLFLQWYLSDWEIGIQSVAIAVVSTLCIYYVFTKFLNVLFPMGPLGFL